MVSAIPTGKELTFIVPAQAFMEQDAQGHNVRVVGEVISG